MDAKFSDINVPRFWSKVDKHGPDECWPWKFGKNRGGYGNFSVKHRGFRAHRIAWMLHNKRQIPEGNDICHKCDNPPCCNPNHLFCGTEKDNMTDCIRKGRKKNCIGETCYLHVLTERDVFKIRSTFDPSVHTVVGLAQTYGVSTGAMASVLKHRSWKHIPWPHGRPTGKLTRGFEARRGENCKRAKLTEGDVRQIRQLASDGIHHRELAAQFKVKKPCIDKIVNRTRWTHI